MKLIPVIDLKAGQVVHAIRGQRDHYQPIQNFSQLSQSCEPVQVVADFLKLYPFECFYIADLDAISGDGHHQPVVECLLTHYPALEFWLDNGAQLAQLEQNQSRYRSVIGTESQRLPPCKIEQDYVLSLDFNQQAMGDQAWFGQHQYWPQSVILMTLSRVGSNHGPDLEKLADFRAIHAEKNLIAAGGIRDIDDLHHLARMGVFGALLASALHSGAISKQQIAEFQAKKYPGKPGYL